MPTKKLKNAHLWERDPHDWYVEPNECSEALFAAERFRGAIWDPACGLGRIVEQAHAAGYKAVGTDIVSRSDICAREADFLVSRPAAKFSNIVSNPPFGLAEEFVQHALTLVDKGGKVAMLLPLVWLSGFSTKRNWLPSSPLRRVYPISPRPSMPPGKVIMAGIKAGNGTKDFAWFVWLSGYKGCPDIEFLNTRRSEIERRRQNDACGSKRYKSQRG